ncbi:MULTISPECIES: AMP-binding protein [Pseudomonas]|jgi:2,3-dihydroxybenzoate-AMP ligase|uniref:AMP-binding protein n=1 Tax=Pseudomonas kielensis TaxID=2762577 RepID=A0A7X1KZ74_9PSED|nr:MULTISPECIES: AMP-binding protein [Pseudomonas]MBC2691571.1 AMP-binding protein [Pseudomonas kielensis]NBB33220.1 AMP-binding protein [Pseudomonas sp. BC115LW]
MTTIKTPASSTSPSFSAGALRHVTSPIPGVVYPKQSELDRYLSEGALGYETLPDGLRSVVEQYPDNVALLGPNLRITYRELDELSTRLAGAFLQQGLQPLDPVVFQLRDSEQLIIAFFACLKAGLIPICTLAAHREREIGYLANLAEAKLHIVQGDDPKFDSIGFARKMQEAAPSLKFIMQVRGASQEGVLHQDALIDGISLQQAQAQLQRVQLDPFQVAVYQLSGGTTGVPKIIPRFHNEYLYNMRAVAQWLGYKPDDVLFMPQPMVHNLNMGCCFGPFLMTGGTVTVTPDLQPETLISLIASTNPTWLMLGGPIIARLESAIQSGRIDLAGARGVLVANSAAKLQMLLGVRTYNVFGITEGVIMFGHKEDVAEAHDTTNGRPVSAWDRVRILVPGTEQDAKPGEIGEPAFKGPYTIHGYFRAEERNRETFTSDGYYRSGDLMYTKVIDGKTYYVFCGRLKDLVSRGGEKINCEEVELAVAGHPAVAAVAAVGYPCAVFDERLCAALVLRDGFAAPSVAELGAYLEDYGLAKFKWPERIEVLDVFPLTASGKLSKEKLRELVKTNVEQELAKQTN